MHKIKYESKLHQMEVSILQESTKKKGGQFKFNTFSLKSSQIDEP